MQEEEVWVADGPGTCPAVCHGPSMEALHWYGGWAAVRWVTPPLETHIMPSCKFSILSHNHTAVARIKPRRDNNYLLAAYSHALGAQERHPFCQPL